MGTFEEIKERKLITPGWYKDMSNEDYHSSSGVSSTFLKKFMEDAPAKILHGTTKPHESTSSMDIGTAVHTMVLEPDKVDLEIAVSPVFNRRTKQGKEDLLRFEVENQGKLILNEKQFEQASAMANSVKSHPSAAILLDDCICESSIYWWYKSMDPDDNTEYKEMLKVRPDAINRSHAVALDLKTTADASYTGFMKSVEKYFYHLSAAMYLEGINQCQELMDELGQFAYRNFVFICVENVEPYLVATYELGKDYLDLGKMIYRACLRNLRSAKENEWPGYDNEIRILEPPAWAGKYKII